MDKVERAIDDLGRRWLPDRRLGVFEVVLNGEPRRLSGRTTSPEALEALRRLAADAGLVAELVRLPDASVGGEGAAGPPPAVAPPLQQPKVSGARGHQGRPGEGPAGAGAR